MFSQANFLDDAPGSPSFTSKRIGSTHCSNRSPPIIKSSIAMTFLVYLILNELTLQIGLLFINILITLNPLRPVVSLAIAHKV
jgi:hypothetical protein